MQIIIDEIKIIQNNPDTLSLEGHLEHHRRFFGKLQGGSLIPDNPYLLDIIHWKTIEKQLREIFKVDSREFSEERINEIMEEHDGVIIIPY
ncbi:hypothetical protein [Metabacillus fastidiosus]|uniref:hypothetical protein n=1 Tax=Metabacillus fastidiosus TaxID=1458 RepID=UPI002E1CCF4C|nr:hypothetical protein [Metabacillus fastidiosus]